VEGGAVDIAIAVEDALEFLNVKGHINGNMVLCDGQVYTVSQHGDKKVLPGGNIDNFP